MTGILPDVHVDVNVVGVNAGRLPGDLLGCPQEVALPQGHPEDQQDSTTFGMMI